MLNDKIYTVSLQRIDLCDIMLALTTLSVNTDSEHYKQKCKRIHDTIMNAIRTQDKYAEQEDE